MVNAGYRHDLASTLFMLNFEGEHFVLITIYLLGLLLSVTLIIYSGLHFRVIYLERWSFKYTNEP